MNNRTLAMDSANLGSPGYRTDEDNGRKHDKFIRLRELGQLQIAKSQRGKLGTLLPCDSHILLFFLFNCSHRNGITHVSIESLVKWGNMSRNKTLQSIKRLIENRCITKVGITNGIIRFKLNPSFYETRGGRFWTKQEEIFNRNSPIRPKIGEYHSKPF